MIELTVDVDNQSGIAGMIAGIRGQLPFAVSLGLNNLADVAQRAVQTALHGEFTLRHEAFIENTIYRKPGQDFATKTNLSATVRVNPARDFLAKFEDGGEKTSISGRSLAVPIVRESAPNLIIKKGDPLSVAVLMTAIANGTFTIKGRKKKGQRVNAARVFLVHNDRGTFILERTGEGPTGNRVLYWFRKSVPIPASLHFDDIAMAAALAAADDEMGRAFEYAMATAR